MAKDKTGFNPDREQNEMRHVEVELDFTPNALASVLYRQGDTVILVCVTKERSLPRWFPRDATKGWVHAEYSLLPGSTDSRFRRERNGAKGRTQEIERLIARSLRAAVDLEALGPVAINVDCDVLNADGGTTLRVDHRRRHRPSACCAPPHRLRRLPPGGPPSLGRRPPQRMDGPCAQRCGAGQPRNGRHAERTCCRLRGAA